MKYILLVSLIVLATSSSLFEKYPLNFSSSRSIMTLMTQIEAKMKLGGPLDAITKMLDDFVVTVTEEQTTHDALFDKQQKECADEFSFREKEVKDAKAALDEATETLDGCSTQKTRAVGDLAITKKQLSENRKFRVQIEETRKREDYAFETKTMVFTSSKKAIEEAIIILEEIWAGEAEFSQLTAHANNMLRDAVKIRKAHLMAPLMSALVQMATSDLAADEALLERVKTLLKNYKEKIEEEYRIAAENEEQSIKTYEEEKKRLDENIAKLEEQLTGLEKEISDLDKCVVIQTGIVQSATQKRDRNQKLWDDAKALCESVEAEYKSASSARKEELELLAAIRERVEARFADLSEGVTERGKQDEFKYENAYEYNKGEFKKE